MKDRSIRAAFVSTNSITQGEQVVAIWEPLGELFNLRIDFAYRSFIWNSEAKEKAHVHVVIIGFSCTDKNYKDKVIFDDGKKIKANTINGYLLNSPDIYIYKVEIRHYVIYSQCILVICQEMGDILFYPKMK